MAHSVFSELSAGFIENMPAYHTKPNRLFLFFTGKYKSAMWDVIYLLKLTFSLRSKQCRKCLPQHIQQLERYGSHLNIWKMMLVNYPIWKMMLVNYPIQKDKQVERAELKPMAWHRSSSRRERGAACSGWDSRTWCVLGSWNEGPNRDWAWWRLDGWGAGRPRCKEGEWGRGHRLPSPPCFVQKLLKDFGFLSRWERLLANIRSVYSYTWILIYFTIVSFYIFYCHI